MNTAELLDREPMPVPMMGLTSHINHKLLKQMKCDFSFLWQRLELYRVPCIYMCVWIYPYTFLGGFLDSIYICVNIYVDYM